MTHYLIFPLKCLYTMIVKRFSFTCKIIFSLLLFTIIYNEYISYKLNSSYWMKMQCENEGKCVKILLVADPQLIGEENEVIHSITPFSILDSDRYLRNSYALAVDHLKPDVVIFLGDLLDEGSIATAIQFNRYLRRLFNIFPTQYPIKHIWLPGDNDIGGETERITDYKIKRFEHAFSQPSIINVKHITFTKVNRMLLESLKHTVVNTNQGFLSVVVCHMPLILTPGLFVNKVLEVIKPKIIFAAHEHKSRLIETNVAQEYRHIVELNEPNNKIYKYKLNTDVIYEVIVPTCSYRMGTKSIGFGAAIIENNETMQYTILWSPDRFTNLYIYFFVTVLIIIIISLQTILSIISKRSHYIKTKPNFMYRIIKNGV